MNILLASVHCLPKLVNGKVAVIEGNTYSLYRPTRYVTIEDDYNPLNYSILVSDKYPKCIVKSSTREIEKYLVNKQLRRVHVPVYRIGDKIHIHSRSGIYSLIDIKDDMLVITCKRWQYEDHKTHTIPNSDFKCLAGGIYNQVYE